MNRYWFDPKYKLIFCPINKVGLSIFKQLFLKFQGDPAYFFDPPWRKGIKNNTLSFDKEKANTMLYNEAWTKVVILRDPFERLVSAFNHLVNTPEGYRLKNQATYFPKSFDAFLEVVTNDSDEIYHLDNHWNPQVSFFDDFNVFNYVIDFSNLKNQGQDLLKQVGVWGEHGKTGWGENQLFPFLEQNIIKHKTEANKKKEKFRQFESRIRKIYKADYDLIENTKFGKQTNGFIQKQSATSNPTKDKIFIPAQGYPKSKNAKLALKGNNALMKKKGPIKENATIIISEWSGRLGNNLIQFSNAIYISKKCNCKLIYPDHKFLKRKDINFSNGKGSFTYITRFYDPIDCYGVYPTIAERRFILQTIVADLLTFDIYDYQDKNSLKDRLVIQMRSGELFLKNPNAKYVPSPLAYFTKIINTHQYKDILIVCEDESNPVIGKVAEIYAPSCKIQSSDLISDIKTIVNAKNLCTTVGTFGFVLTLFSKNIEKLYVDNIPKALLDFGYFRANDLGLDFRVYRCRIKDYISFGDWKNNPVQYKRVFELPEDKIEMIAPIS